MRQLIFAVLLCVVRAYLNPMDIVGGTDAMENMYPYQVSIQDTLFESHFCGGSLVKAGNGDIVVVTAAHCFPYSSADSIQVKVGEHKLDVTDKKFEKVYTVKKIVLHPGFDLDSLTNDIALIFLNEKVKLNAGVQAIPLTDKPTVNWFNRKCNITGWGVTQEGGDLAQTLQKAEVFMFPDVKCSEGYLGDYFKRTMFCGGMPEGGIDSCQGDSGGPFACKDDAYGEFVLNGVVSWGYGCARPGLPGVYADVYMMRPWLNARLGL